jgi:hypothetical protein
MGGEQLSALGDSDYREIAEEIAEEMKESAESARHKLSALPPLPSPSDLWNLLSRYPIAWFAIGVVVVVIITVLFFEPLYCVIEFRLTEAIVALIALLAVGAAGMTFRIAPPQTDKVLQSLYGGVAVTFIIVVMVMQFLPPPSREDCFPMQVPVPTTTSTPTYTMTPASTETPSNTPAPTPTPVAILSPSEGKEVSIQNSYVRSGPQCARRSLVIGACATGRGRLLPSVWANRG